MAKRKKVTPKVDNFANQPAKKPAREKRLVPKNALNHITLNEKQKELLKIIEKNQIITIYGPSGTSKTFLDCFYAIKGLITHKYDKIIFSKPLEESGENLGFLPGGISEKMSPFMDSYKSNILKMISKPNLEKLIKDEIIDFRPLAFMRGATFDNSLMILDEAQNANLTKLMLFVTRMGIDSKVIISGDVRQYDIKKKEVGVLFFKEMIKDIPGVAEFEFTKDDIVRNEILKAIVERYEDFKEDENFPQSHNN